MAVLGFWRTGLVAAVPAATGLTMLAASDLTTRRISLRTLGHATALVLVGLVIDAARSSAWDRLVTALAVTGVAALAILGVWVNTAGIAFGDVLLVTFAVLIPAWLSPWVAGATILVAIMAGAAAVVVQRHARPTDRPPVTVALGPALLAGWTVAMVVG